MYMRITKLYDEQCKFQLNTVLADRFRFAASRDNISVSNNSSRAKVAVTRPRVRVQNTVDTRNNGTIQDLESRQQSTVSDLQNGTRTTTTTTDQVKDRRNKMSDESHLIDVVIPSILIAGLLLGNAIVVFIIYKYRKRKNLDIHEEELDTIVADPTIVP